MRSNRQILLGIGLLVISATSFAVNEQDCMRIFNSVPPQANLEYFVSQLGSGEVVAQGDIYLWRRGEFTLSIGDIGEIHDVKIYPQAGNPPTELIQAVQMRSHNASMEEIEAFLGQPTQKIVLRKIRWLCEDAHGNQFEHYALIDADDHVFDHLSFIVPVD